MFKTLYKNILVPQLVKNRLGGFIYVNINRIYAYINQINVNINRVSVYINRISACINAFFVYLKSGKLLRK